MKKLVDYIYPKSTLLILLECAQEVVNGAIVDNFIDGETSKKNIPSTNSIFISWDILQEVTHIGRDSLIWVIDSTNKERQNIFGKDAYLAHRFPNYFMFNKGVLRNEYEKERARYQLSRMQILFWLIATIAAITTIVTNVSSISVLYNESRSSVSNHELSKM